jgi:hypothetical protein
MRQSLACLTYIEHDGSVCSAGVWRGSRPKVCPSPRIICREAYCSEVGSGFACSARRDVVGFVLTGHHWQHQITHIAAQWPALTHHNTSLIYNREILAPCSCTQEHL